MDAPHTNHAMLMPFQDLQYLQKSLITVDSMCHQLTNTLRTHLMVQQRQYPKKILQFSEEQGVWMTSFFWGAILTRSCQCFGTIGVVGVGVWSHMLGLGIARGIALIIAPMDTWSERSRSRASRFILRSTDYQTSTLPECFEPNTWRAFQNKSYYNPQNHMMNQRDGMFLRFPTALQGLASYEQTHDESIIEGFDGCPDAHMANGIVSFTLFLEDGGSSGFGPQLSWP